ncbi:hypothetical protein ACSBR1_004224 [Camellia fascicularis]
MDLSQSIDSQEVVEDEDVGEPTATPLWKYVAKISDESPNSKGGGGSTKFICNFGCKLTAYTSSYSESSDVPRSVKVSIDNMFHVRNKEEVDQTIARCLYSNGIAFNVVRSSWCVDMVTAINNAPKEYKSPNYEKVRTSLLDKQQSKVQQSLNPLMQDWSIHGVSIVSDGWSNLKNQTLINMMAFFGGKAIVINGHDVSSKEKNATNSADLLFKAIEFVGPSNVVQVITDNATNYKAVRAIIQRKYSHIFWSGCLAHTLNLSIKDIAKCEDPTLLFVDESYKKGKEVVKYIKNHSSCQYLFKTLFGLDLLKAKKTRFGHRFIVLQCLVKVRPALLSMALSKQWKNLRKSTPSPLQHDIVHQTIMDDDFWRKAKRVLTITKRIYKMIRFSYSDKAVIGEVYELMDTMLGNIKDTLSNDPIVYDLIHQFVVERWDKMNIPLHCLAYILVPKYYTNYWLSKSVPGGVRRIKPHFDVEVQKGYPEAIEKMICDQIEAGVIRKQISDFVSCKGILS